eukprot:tig00000796_g4235.t1
MAICMTALPRINCNVNCKGAEAGRGHRARARRSLGEESPEPEPAPCVIIISDSDSELPELLSPKSAGSMASAASSAASSRASSRSNSLALDREPGGAAPPPRPPLEAPELDPPAIRARLVLNIWEASARGPGDRPALGAGAGAPRRPPDPHHSASLACANWAVDSRGRGAMTREAFEGSLEALAAGWAAAAAREPTARRPHHRGDPWPAAAPRPPRPTARRPACALCPRSSRLLRRPRPPAPARHAAAARPRAAAAAAPPRARARGPEPDREAPAAGAGLAGLLAGDGDPRGLRRFALHNRLRALLPAPAPAFAAAPRRGRGEGDIGLPHTSPAASIASSSGPSRRPPHGRCPPRSAPPTL